MRETIDTERKARLSVGDDERVRQISYTEQPWESSEESPLMAAVEYLRQATDVLTPSPEELANLLREVSFSEPRQQGVEYHLGKQKPPQFDSSTIIFNQTYLNVPVWRAAITLTIKHNPNRVILVDDTSEQGMDAPLPPAEKIEEYRRLFALAEAERRLRVLGLEDQAVAVGLAEDDAEPKTAWFVRRVLGRAAPSAAEGADAVAPAPDDARAIRGRFFVYRYDESRRVPRRQSDTASPESLQESAPSPGVESRDDAPVLPLPPVAPSIADGAWRLVSEVTFTLTTPEFGTLNWRSLVDVETDSVLLLEPLVAGQFGFVFHRDPISSSGNLSNSPDRGNSVLNPLRNSVQLPNVDAPVNGTQRLRGRFAVVADVNSPSVAPPTAPAGQRFDFDVRTNDFAAVNAYYHTDRFFALVESLGFPIASYFNNTTVPIRVDHRDNVDTPGNTINAWCIGNGAGGIDYAGYALNDLSNTNNPIGRACDSRVHLHELGGHGILYEHVDHPNFGFAHSAGDSLSAILHDPESRLRNDPQPRFRYAPWNPVNTRRFDRDVTLGWAWGGPSDKDDKGYGSEQILCTTMFRVYRSVGGDSADLNERRFASRLVMYLILRAISTLTPATNPRNALGFANALMAVDLLNWTTEGVFGGAYNKVIRWSFEKQGLFQAQGAPTPVRQAGQPPAVDVFINDGRNGEYQYQPVFSNNQSVWNRRAADAGTTHQEPLAGVTNFAYVRVKNRGTATAPNVRVRGFHHKAGGATVWPTDFEPLTTPRLVAGTLAPRGQEEKIVGPFAWVPVADAIGRDTLMMVVSADGDASNIDHFTADESIPEWRLVPNDNNTGLRRVTPVAAESAPPPSAAAAAPQQQAGGGTASAKGAVEQLLQGLGLSGQRAKGVRVKTLTLQVELEDEGAASESSSSGGEAGASGPRRQAASLPTAKSTAASESFDAASWGMRRHAAIATAASERLQSQNARSEITRILEESGEESLGEAARWADRLRSSNRPHDPATNRFLADRRNRGFGTWHYVNLPLELDGYSREQHPEFTRRDDVVQIILRCVEALRNPGPRARFEEITALRWLTHLVGDVHQPVHVGCGYIADARTNQARIVTDPEEAVGLPSDLGGNELLLPNGSNLHSYWDSQLGPDFVADAVNAESDDLLVRALVAADVPAAADQSEDLPARVAGWANVSLEAAREAYSGLRILGYVPNDDGDYPVEWEGEAAYRQRCSPIVSARMSAAAVNLAALLDTIWP